MNLTLFLHSSYIHLSLQHCDRNYYQEIGSTTTPQSSVRLKVTLNITVITFTHEIPSRGVKEAIER